MLNPEKNFSYLLKLTTIKNNLIEKTNKINELSTLKSKLLGVDFEYYDKDTDYISLSSSLEGLALFDKEKRTNRRFIKNELLKDMTKKEHKSILLKLNEIAIYERTLDQFIEDKSLFSCDVFSENICFEEIDAVSTLIDDIGYVKEHYLSLFDIDILDKNNTLKDSSYFINTIEGNKSIIENLLKYHSQEILRINEDIEHFNILSNKMKLFNELPEINWILLDLVNAYNKDIKIKELDGLIIEWNNYKSKLVKYEFDLNVHMNENKNISKIIKANEKESTHKPIEVYLIKKESYKTYTEIKHEINNSKIHISNSLMLESEIKDDADYLSNLNYLLDKRNTLSSLIEFNSLSKNLNDFTEANQYSEEIVDLLLKKDFSSIDEVKKWFDNRFIYLNGKKIFNKGSVSSVSSNALCRLEELHKEASSSSALFKDIASKQKFTKKKEYQVRGIKGQKVSEKTELNLLNREMNKETEFVSFRSLFKRSFNAMITLKPCVMLSPTNVSKFLPQEKDMFDLLIIDEASQLKVVDGFGSLLRSKKAIIVGDKNQLPPIERFVKVNNNLEEEDISIADESESLLEFCENFYSKYGLKWHYRSKYPELISFSNREYYKNELVVFPSIESGHKAISHYDLSNKGFFTDNKNNPIEADSLLHALKMEIRHQIQINQYKSLGIIVSNSSQKKYIIEKIEEDFEKDAFFIKQQKNVGSEKLFVKDIENVQGDERDIIFISTVYGKNKDGKIYQRFGTFNEANSHRFINVMMSRAKEHIHFFTSLKYTEISDDDFKNVKHFRNLIQYCSNVDSQAALFDSLEKEYDSEFEEVVDKEINKMGYETHAQVSSEGFKIDLSVLSKDKKRYILAVECDGAQYHSSPYAKDRDFNRQSILENKGWKFFRIWSSDWNAKKDSVLNDLQKTIEDEQANYEYNFNLNNTNTIESSVFEETSKFKNLETKEVDIIVKDKDPVSNIKSDDMLKQIKLQNKVAKTDINDYLRIDEDTVFELKIVTKKTNTEEIKEVLCCSDLSVENKLRKELKLNKETISICKGTPLYSDLINKSVGEEITKGDKTYIVTKIKEL